MPRRFLRDPDTRTRLYRLARSISSAAPDDPHRRADHRRLLIAVALSRAAGLDATLSLPARLESVAVLGYWPALRLLDVLGRTDLAVAAPEIEARVDADGLRDDWRDPAAVGWLHQAFTDPDREVLDGRIQRGHRLGPDELAAKTQVFTEPWMAAWLVQNTLGPLWLRWCDRRGLVPHAHATGVIERLAQRRLSPDKVPLDTLHPDDTLAARWVFYIEPHDDALASLEPPDDLSTWRVLDPACGAGHLLLAALDYLVAMRLEASALQQREVHRGDVVAQVVADNLRGFDLDGEVAALASALLTVRARQLAGVPGTLETVPGTVVGPGDCPVLGRLGALADPRARAALGDVLDDGRAHVVLSNPPWLSSRKTALPEVDAAFPVARVDLYACFVEQGLRLVTPGGQLGFVTQHGWMFLRRFERFRRRLLERVGIDALAHLGRGGGFEDWADLDKVMQTVLFVARPGRSGQAPTPCYRLDALDNRDKALALADEPPTHHRALDDLREIPEWPLVYWWSDEALRRFLSVPPLGRVAPVKQGIATADNRRFVRNAWEVPLQDILLARADDPPTPEVIAAARWVPYIKGAAGKRWIEPVDHVLRWHDDAAELRTSERAVLRNESWWFRPGVAFTYIGSGFGARLHRYCSVFDVAGSSVFHDRPAEIACVMNSAAGRAVLESLNPTVNFQVGDVERLPCWPQPDAARIYAVLEAAFAEHEAGREPSVEFVRPGPSHWEAAQQWAQRAVDRPDGEPLPSWDPPAPVPATAGQHLSFEVGIALGRLHRDGGRTIAQPDDALPGAVMMIGDGTVADSLDTPPCQRLRARWPELAGELDADETLDGLRHVLRERFFDEIHLPMYARCPVYLPIDGGGAGFALVGVHGLGEPTWRQLSTWLAAVGDPDLARRLGECVERGPAGREVDAPLHWTWTDGVELNAAPLWPVLERRWSRPRQIWRALVEARSRRKAAVWSAVVARYWPSRLR